MLDKLSKIELDVMNMLLSGEDDNLKTLRKQFDSSQVTGTRLTDVGKYVDFQILQHVRRIQKPYLVLGDVIAEVPRLKGGIMFSLFVIDGKIEFLEYTCFENSIPINISLYTLHYWYNHSKKVCSIRDMNYVRAEIYDI